MTAPDRLVAALADRYAFERPLGTGGMATVWLARDLRHDRQVAIKVLKPELAAVLGAERFVQEIKTTAALSHPHILPLFDSGEAQGLLWYAMPYVEGETLRDRLDRETQLGVDEAVHLTTAVADALDYAHRHGVIHRDIKPENILLHDGRPMVADFGIALALSAAAGGRMTETGLSLGTPHYMSPEQATADKEITARSDIYSLGSVCYEMLTGDPPHTGSSAQQIIMKIVTEDAAPVTRHRKNVPAHVAAAVGKAIEKLPADRFATAKAFAEALANPAFTTARVTGETDRPAGGPPARLTAALLALALLATAAAAWGWLRVTPAPAAAGTPWRTSIPLPDTVRMGSGLTISPDGGRVVFATVGSGPLWERLAGQLDLHLIPGTDGGGEPALAPDGRRVAYLRGAGELAITDIDGGTHAVVTDSVRLDSPLIWQGGDRIVFANVGGLGRVRASGGPIDRLTVVDTAAGEGWHLAPSVLPDGKGILFTVFPAGDIRLSEARLALVGPDGGPHTILGPGAYAQAAGPGWVIARSGDGSLVAIALDADARRFDGPPVTLVGNLPGTLFHRAGQYAVSPGGRLVYTPDGGQENQAALVRVQRDGAELPLTDGSVDAYQSVAGSPDGRRVALGIVGDESEELRLLNLATGSALRLAIPGVFLRQPVFSRDGRWVVFVGLATPPAPIGIFRAPVDGSAPPELLAPLDVQRLPGAPTLTPDGTRAYFMTLAGGGNTAIATVELPTGEDGIVERIEKGTAPSLSPDGRWLAYGSNESGRFEVYVEAVSLRGGERWRLSRTGVSTAIRWSRDGRELFYGSADSLYAVPIAGGDDFTSGAPRALFGREGLTGSFDVLPDGSFLMLRERPEAGAPSALVMIEDWRSLLPR